MRSGMLVRLIVAFIIRGALAIREKDVGGVLKAAEDVDAASSRTKSTILEALQHGLEEDAVGLLKNANSEAIKYACKAVETLLTGLEVGLPEGFATASFEATGVEDVMTGTLVLHLTEQMRGELATKSRVPLQWVVNDGATFKIKVVEGGVALEATGLFQLPFEGLALYEEYQIGTDPIIWADSTPEQKKEALAGELKKFYSQMSAGSFSKAFLESMKHKQSRVWDTIYQITGYSMLLGSKNGAKILFPVMIAKPARIDEIVFADYNPNGKKSLGVRVTFVTSIHGNGETIDHNGEAVPLEEYYERYSLQEKTDMLFDPVSFPKERALIESKAGSGMNFAASMAAGSKTICEKNKNVCIEGGKPDKVIKFMMACVDPAVEKKGWENLDRSYKCQGDKMGRVLWRTKSVYEQTP